MKKYRASKLTVRELENKDVKDFLDKYHKQKWIFSEVCFGLFDGEELLQVETFGKPRIEMQAQMIWHDWELLRECSKSDCQIYGGKSKLLKAFETKYHPLCLLSYCSITEGFDGHSYAACGFKLERTSQDYWYEYNGVKIQRYRMQKNKNMRLAGKVEPIQKTLERFGKIYNPDLSEKENAVNAGFTFVRGNGQQVWTKLYSDFVGCVYIVTNKVNGRFYIGQHAVYTKSIHRTIDYWGSGLNIKKAIEKYGESNFKKEVLEWCDNPKTLIDRETYWINNLWDDDLIYNIDKGSGLATGKWRYRSGLTTIEKIMKTKSDPEWKANHPAWNKGLKNQQIPWNKGLKGYKTKPMSEETKAKISAANKGRKVKDTSKMIGNRNGCKPRSFWKCLETGEIKSTGEWLSLGYKVHRIHYKGLTFEKCCFSK